MRVRTFVLIAVVLAFASTLPSGPPCGATETGYWSPAFDLPGLNGIVHCVIELPTGLVVAGGEFTTAGGLPVNHIAAWNGTSWSPLGTGMDGVVHALLVHDGVLIAGGEFTRAGGIAANYVAAWNGAGWSALGGGLPGNVLALCEYDSALVAGGIFSPTTPGCVARWDGSGWTRLEGGPLGFVNALAVYQGQLYAAGEFTRIGTTPVTHIARYDGTRWSSTGASFVSALYALAVHNGYLYTGHVDLLARYDGAGWVTDPSRFPYPPIYALVSRGGVLYGGGGAITAATPGGVCRWDGEWTSLLSLGAADPGGCGTRLVRALGSRGGELIAGGLFYQAGEAAANHVARWDGTSWRALDAPIVGGGLDCDVNAFASYGGETVAGGSFRHASGAVANRIASWNGRRWLPLGTGVDDAVWCLHAFGGDLIAGGDFASAGGVTAQRVARWDGTSWHAMGTGVEMTGSVRSMATWRDELYAVNRGEGVARWTGSAWSVLPAPPFQVGNGLVVYGDELVVSAFDGEGKIAAWNGTSWRQLGTGVGLPGQFPIIMGMAVTLGRLFAGGDFQYPGWDVAQWDGSSWTAVGSLPNDPVYTLGTYRGDLVSGGIIGVRRWDGVSWHYLDGAGITYALLGSGDDLFIGGSFNHAGGWPSWNVAMWSGTAPATSVSEPAAAVTAPVNACASIAITVEPNPSRQGFRLHCEGPSGAAVRVRIHDARGRLVATPLEPGRRVLPLDVNWTARDGWGHDMAPGVYFARVEAGGASTVARLVVTR